MSSKHTAGTEHQAYSMRIMHTGSMSSMHTAGMSSMHAQQEQHMHTAGMGSMGSAGNKPLITQETRF